jgi:hypothetical protein
VNRELRRLAARKQVLLAELQLQRMQMSLYAGEAREALRPDGLIGGAVARPAAAMALIDTVARLLGWYRLARVVRLSAIVLTAYRIARLWRVRQRTPSSPS